MVYSSVTSSPTVNVESLSFVDVTSNTRGSFLEPGNLNKFLNSTVGQAQANLLREEISNQGVTPTDSKIRRVLYAEQSSQDFAYSTPDIVADGAPNPEGKMTESQLIENYGPEAKPRELLVDPAPGFNRSMNLA